MPSQAETIRDIRREEWYTVHTAAKVLGVTKGTIYEKIRTKKLRKQKDGRLILGAEILRYAGPAVELLAPTITDSAFHRRDESARKRIRELAMKGGQ